MADLNYMGQNTIAEAIGIEVISIEKGEVKGKLPVDSRTHQPYGLLHGGASVVLAETLGSVGSHFLVSSEAHLVKQIQHYQIFPFAQMQLRNIDKFPEGEHTWDSIRRNLTM